MLSNPNLRLVASDVVNVKCVGAVKVTSTFNTRTQNLHSNKMMIFTSPDIGFNVVGALCMPTLLEPTETNHLKINAY